ncbi:GNAT family N-acetyltransferase [Neisseriaceae bacterium B1]
MKHAALHQLFYPHHLAVVGASDRYGTAGRSVFSQLQTGNIAAKLVPINPKHKAVGSVKAYESLTAAAQEFALDTAIVIVAADKVVSVVREAVKVGVRQIVIINELDPAPSSVRRQLERAAEVAMKADVLLFALPVHGVEGVFLSPQHTASAYIGHGESVADCMDNYARERGISFSRFLPLNPQTDYSVSTGQLIDYIANESETTSLLVHVSELDNPRHLLSALAAAARRKPVVVLSTLVDSDEEQLFLQALERQHVLVARTLTEFFTAAKLIHTRLTARGNRLLIVSNTRQIGALTFKAMAQEGIEASQPSVSTQRALQRILPYKTDNLNPFYLPADAAPGLFQAALECSLTDEYTDAVMLICTGRNNADNRRTAQMVAQMQGKARKPILLVWLGSADTSEIRQFFNENKNLHFKQPDHALQALANLNLYRHYQQQRQELSAFHDYRYASGAAETLHQYLRPVLPMVAVPASKNASNRLFEALRLERMGRKKAAPQLYLNWQQRPTLGQVASLINEQASLNLLPPFTPEMVANSCQMLGLTENGWHEWLLNAAEILNRLPEIASLQLELAWDNGVMTGQVLKFSLQEPDQMAQNVFPPLPTTEEVLHLKDGRLAYVRPVRPEDASLLQQHIEQMDAQSRYMRFLSRFDTPPVTLLARLSHPDYQRDYALIVHDKNNEVLATANYTADPNLISCEFGISTAPSLQGQGIGRFLMERLIARAREQGFKYMRAEILADNHPMQKLALKLGFVLNQHPDDSSMVEARLVL